MKHIVQLIALAGATCLLAGCMTPQMPKIARPPRPVDTVAKAPMGTLNVQLVAPTAGRRILATFDDISTIYVDTYRAEDDPENNPGATPLNSQTLDALDVSIGSGDPDPVTGIAPTLMTLDPILVTLGQSVIVVVRAEGENQMNPGAPDVLLGLSVSDPTVVNGNTTVDMQLNLIDGTPGAPAQLTPVVTVINGL